MRRIIGVTGIRSEYEILSPVFRALTMRPEVHLSLLVTGAHLSKTFGHTIEQIQQDGFEIAETVENLLAGDRDVSRLKGSAIQLQGFTQAIDRLRPDMLLVLGDREEAMNTALVGAYLNIPVAHLSGGDRVVGNVEDQIRHAVTKLAHLHLVTNEESRERVLKMGEQPFRVHNVGHPGLDRLVQTQQIVRQDLLEKLGFDSSSVKKPFVIVIQHPISSDINASYDHMHHTVEAVQALGLNALVIYPNSDPGSQEIIRCIQEYADCPNVRIFRHLPRPEFVNALRHAACLVGNSSAGILEAPFLKLPVVNVGMRQLSRLHAENVQFVQAEQGAILTAIRRACFDEAYRAEVAHCHSPYGDGHSSEKIANLLATVPLDTALLVKDMAY